MTGVCTRVVMMLEIAAVYRGHDKYMTKFTECLAQSQAHSRYRVQADLGDTAGSIPDHHNNANIAIKEVTRIFCFPVTLYHGLLYCSHVCNSIVSKKQCTYLNFKLFYC